MSTMRSAPKRRIRFILAKSFTLSAIALFVDTLLRCDQDCDRAHVTTIKWDCGPEVRSKTAKLGNWMVSTRALPCEFKPMGDLRAW